LGRGLENIVRLGTPLIVVAAAQIANEHESGKVTHSNAAYT